MTTIPLLDQTRKMEETPYGSAVRLSNELRPKPERTIIINRITGTTITYPAESGFNFETAPYSDYRNWLTNGRKKSNSILMFILRAICWRFPAEYSQIKANLPSGKWDSELQMIESNMRKEVEWLGEVDWTNMIRYDGSLNNPKVKTVEMGNGSWKTIQS